MFGLRIIRAQDGANRIAALALFLIAFFLGGASAAAQQTPFGVDDAINLTRVSDPRMSPDGERVLFSRSELDWDENERITSLWIVNADGTDARRFTGEDGDSGARWSPDGRWVAFLRSSGDGEERRRQVFLIRTDGGEARALTGHPTSVRSFEWGDANSIFFLANDSLPDEEEERREDGYDAIFVDEAPNGQTRGEWSSIWMIGLDPEDEEDAEARRLTTGNLRIGQFAVAPGAERVAYTYRHENRRNDGYLSEIALLDVASGETRDLTDNEAPESSLAWSPDGTRLAFGAPDLETWELDQGNLYVMDIESGDVRQMAPDMMVDIRGTPQWHPSGKAFYFAGLDRTVAHLYRLDAESGALEAVSSGDGILSAPSFSADFTRYAFTHNTPTAPGDIYSAQVDGGAHTRITEANPWMAERQLAEPEVVQWTSRDGLPIEGILYRSLSPEAQSLVLEIHGGPAGVFTRGFDADAQILAAAGYSIIQPNVRGSSGYGDELLRGNMNDIGGRRLRRRHDRRRPRAGDRRRSPGLAVREGLELRRHSGRLDHHPDRPLQGREPGGDGVGLAERVRNRLPLRRAALVSGRRPLVEPEPLARALRLLPPRPGDHPDHPLPRGAGPDGHHGAVDELLRGADAPRRREPLHSLPARGPRHLRAPASPHAPGRGAALAGAVCPRQLGLGSAGAARGRREATSGDPELN